jgi:hypothetical protein
VITTTLRDAAPDGGDLAAARRTRQVRRGRMTFALLVLACVMPVAASYLAYYVWPPEGRVNYGTLLPPAPLPRVVLPGAAGQPGLERAEMDGRWTLLYAGAGACDGPCEAALYAMRQSRLAQASEMERVVRVWLVTDSVLPPAALLAAHDGLRVARARDEWLAQLPGAAAAHHVFLVDPLGNVMMRFPERADPKGVIKDLQRLLKYSALGRG